MKPGKLSLLLIFTFVFVILVTGGIPASAQTSTQGAITGTTTDASGAVVPGTTVTIVNDATNSRIVLQSNANGDFLAPLLEPGSYTVTFSSPGFQTFIAQKVLVQVSQSTKLSAQLRVGETSTRVEVTSDAPLTDTVSPDFSSNLNSARSKIFPSTTAAGRASRCHPGVTVTPAALDW